MAIEALMTDKTGKAIKDALASIQQAIQQQVPGGQGGGVSISVETDPEALTTLSQSVVYFLGPGTWTAFSPAVTVPEGKFGIAKYGTAWAVTVLGGRELAAAIAAMTAADELTGDEALPMGSGESVTVQQLAEFAEGVVGGNAAHVSGETADQAKLASVGKVQELIGDGRRVVPVTSTPATLDQDLIYLVHNSSSDITFGAETVLAGTTARVYFDGTGWVVVTESNITPEQMAAVNQAATVVGEVGKLSAKVEEVEAIITVEGDFELSNNSYSSNLDAYRSWSSEKGSWCWLSSSTYHWRNFKVNPGETILLNCKNYLNNTDIALVYVYNNEVQIGNRVGNASNIVVVNSEESIGSKEWTNETDSIKYLFILSRYNGNRYVDVYRKGVMTIKDVLPTKDVISSCDCQNCDENDFSPLFDLKTTSDTDTDTIDFDEAARRKLLIAIHRRNQGTYKKTNDIFLPNARKDFADVRISDDNGVTLAQKTIFRGNVECLKNAALNELIGRVWCVDNVLYAGSKTGGICKSEDEGLTWSKMQSISQGMTSQTQLCHISNDGTMFFGSQGVLYKSNTPYSSKNAVLDENQTHQNSMIVATSMTEDDQGGLYIGHYQSERDIIIRKSTDGGDTWDIIYRDQSDKYQHVHSIFFDHYTNTIYVGCDGGNGVLKSSDYGLTWEDMRDEIPNMPKPTDYGVIYSESGFRIFAGETSIVGGSTLIKSTDDQTFIPILSCGKACYYVVRCGGYLVCSVLSSENMRSTELLYSKDDGITWSTLYATSPHNDGGASDGFRDLSVVNVNGHEKLFVISQGASFDSMEVMFGGENYFEEVLVDTPDDATSITIETGFAAKKGGSSFNTEVGEDRLIYAPMSDSDIYVGGELFNVLMPKKYIIGGRRIADLYPPIVSQQDMRTLLIPSGFCMYSGSYSLPNEFHVGFWMRSDINTSLVHLLYCLGFDLSIVNGYQLHVNSVNKCSFNFPILTETSIRVDINITLGDNIEVYVNGLLSANTSLDVDSLGDNLKVLKNDGDSPFAIQHFEVTNNTITADEALKRFTGGLTD